MKTLKRVLCLVFALLAISSLCACSGNSEPTEAPTLNPVELEQPKLEEAYNTCCDGFKDTYAKLGYDKKSLTIDTNPKDSKYSNIYEDNAIAAIQKINLHLGLPSSLLEKMSNTRALDGTQSQNCGTYTVTWNYHPDSGLKVIYEINP